MSHQQFRLADEFAVFLLFDGPHGDGTAFVHIKAVGLSGIHLGVGCAVAHQGTLADLGVDAPGNQERDVDIGIFQLQRLIKAEQCMFGGAVGTS